jgi:hypothetical protein
MGERGRLRSSHEMLKAALELPVRGKAFVPFYLAVANFMEASMGRLNSQDVKMLARLAEKLGDATAEQDEVIAEVNRRLDGNREHLTKFLGCRSALQDNPTDNAAIEAFESVSTAYIDYIHNRMGHHAPSTDMARELFTEPDWLDIADLDAAYFATEKQLYTAVIDSRPASVPLGLAAEEYVEKYRSDKGLK